MKNNNKSEHPSFIGFLKDKKVRKYLILLLVGISIACFGSIFAQANKIFVTISIVGIAISFASTNQIIKIIQSS